MALNSTDYLKINTDVYDAWQKDGQGKSADEFANWHYQNYGQNEGRTTGLIGSAAPAEPTVFQDYLANPHLIPRMHGETEEQAAARISTNNPQGAPIPVDNFVPGGGGLSESLWRMIGGSPRTEVKQENYNQIYNPNTGGFETYNPTTGAVSGTGTPPKPSTPVPTPGGPPSTVPGTPGGSAIQNTGFGFSTSGNGASLRNVAANETIEGRMGSLLATDEFGNYTNQVVRQAADRALQAFAGRGLLNSSMAQQAAQEAAIAKAIEITGPDAQRFFEQGRANQDALNQFGLSDKGFTQDMAKIASQAGYDIDKIREQAKLNTDAQSTADSFNLRQNYVTSVQNANSEYNARVSNINQSGMSPDDKQTAVRNATIDHQASLAAINTMFNNMPNWQSEWSAVAVPTEGLKLDSSMDYEVLRNIANDPAQPEATRQQARDLLASMPAKTTENKTTQPTAVFDGLA
jgi:hypothetical protein